MAVVWHGEKVMAQIHARAEAKMDASAEMLVKRVKDSFREPKSGREAPAGKKRIRGFITRRSAPGEPPAVQYGHLLRSIVWENIGQLARRVGTNIEYGLGLELGKRNMAARPFLRPAFDQCKERIRALWSRP